MNWSDYEAVWKRQPVPVGADADVAHIRQTFEAKRRKLAGSLVVRDYAELAACVFVVVSYARFWSKVGTSGWPMGIAILIIAGVGLKFIRERMRIRRQRLSADAPLVLKISADLAELQHQRRLLLNIWTWYLGPCAAAMIIHGYVIMGRAKPWEPIRQPLFIVGFGVFFAAVFAFAWVINRRALHKRIEPRIHELEKLKRDVLSEVG
jgi:hypothetical protein